MRRIKAIFLSVIIAAISAVTLVYAQTASNFLTVSSFVGDVEYKIGDGDWVKVAVDTQVPENAILRVNSANGYVVLSMSDGSEFKLFGLTSVSVGEVLRSAEGRQRSFFQLLAGKIFAAVTPGANQDFRVETGSAVAAVRGTKFGMSYTGGRSGSGDLVVVDGTVEVSDPQGGSAPVSVTRGMFTSFSPTGGITPPAAATPQLLAQYDQPADAATATTTTTTVAPATTTTTTVARTDTGNVDIPDTTQTTQPDQQTTTAEEGTGTPGGIQPSDSETQCSPEGFNWSVSSENISGSGPNGEDVVWNKVLLAPTFKFADGKFILALYLPVYFQNLEDLIRPVSWYNYWQDWNFGSGGVTYDWVDLFHDIFMKIKFMQIKTDKLLIKFGNIPSMSVGHGILVNDYANDIQFPAIRRIGLQFNMDLGVFGFETMSGDLFLTKLFAMRMYVRPLYKKTLLKNLAIGISGFMDLDPLGQAFDHYDVFGYAADLDLPILKLGGVFDLTVFFDIGTLGNTTVTDTVWTHGYGYETGIFGKVIGIDYRAAFKSVNNGFIDSYVDRFYDVERASRFATLMSYDPATTPNYNGFIVGAGKSFENVGGINLSFEQLFPAGLEELGLSVTNVAPNNFVHIELFVDKCVFKKAYGRIAYDRQNFYVKDFFTQFFGDGVVVTTQLYYEIAAGAYVGITYKRFYDANGNAENTYALETTMGL